MNRLPSNAGFSLIEVMCAIVILGVALTGLTEGITAALSSSKDTELQTAASLLAAAQVETLRASGTVIDGQTQGDCGDKLPLYQWSETITPTDLDGLHKVTVEVQNSRSGQSIYELSTLLFDPDYPSQDENGSKKEKAHDKKRRKKT
jgi:prepilin-type N-terminal cleavage/methylation domain-containing protein